VTYLALIPLHALPVMRQGWAQMLKKTRKYRSGSSRGIVHRAGSTNRHEGERSA